MNLIVLSIELSTFTLILIQSNYNNIIIYIMNNLEPINLSIVDVPKYLPDFL